MSHRHGRNRETTLEFDVPPELQYREYGNGYQQAVRDMNGSRSRSRSRNVVIEGWGPGYGHGHDNSVRHRGEDGCTCYTNPVTGCTCPEYAAEMEAYNAQQRATVYKIAGFIVGGIFLASMLMH